MLLWIVVIVGFVIFAKQIKKLTEDLSHAKYRADTALGKAKNLETELERVRKELNSLRNASAAQNTEEKEP